jgi:O-antigen/teichoic acid export membrane protein
MFFDTVSAVPFAALRLQRRPWLFALMKTATIVINVGSNVVLLMVFKMGVEGIFLSGVVASAATTLMLIPGMVRGIEPTIPPGLIRALLAFGLPYVPAGLASMMIQVIDRPILRMLTDDATVGIYQANYRLGIFMMLVVSMYDYAWRPFFLSHAKEPGAKALFARAMTLFVLAGTTIVLLLSLFIPHLVGIRMFGGTLIGRQYWAGLSIVPVVLLGYLFLGIYNNLIAGVYIEKKTKLLPFVTAAGAFVNIAANLVLIPSMGIMGAALATLAAYVVMALVLYFTVQRFYPVEYEWGKIGIILGAGGVAWMVSRFPMWGAPEIAWQLIAAAVFPVLLALTGVIRPAEIASARQLFARKNVSTNSEQTTNVGDLGKE